MTTQCIPLATLCVCLVFTAGNTSMADPPAELTLVKGGTSSWQIAMPAGSAPALRYAANELRQFLLIPRA
jgi:hypothetical protein